MLPPFRLPALVLCLVLACLGLAGPAQASNDQVTTFEAPGELLDDSRRDRTLDEIRALGVTRVRQLVFWDQIAPDRDAKAKPAGFDATNPDAYPAGAWGRWDRLLDALQARGMDAMFTLTGPAPKWATKGKRSGITDPIASEFGAFAAAAARRWTNRVDVWSIWNEPNQPQFLMPQFKRGRPASPALYRGLYTNATRSIRATGDGASDQVLLGETSPRGNRNIVAPLAFLRGVTCLKANYRSARRCSKLDADGWAHHAYTTRAGPSFVPPGRDDVTIGVLPRLTTALDRAARAGRIDKSLAVHLTEFGIQSKPDPIIGVSLATQAEFLSISEHIAYLNRRVQTFSQYLMRDDQPRTTGSKYGGFESGLRTSDGEAKPAYDAFRLPLAADDYGRSDVLWGRVRPVGRRVTTITLLVREKGAKRDEVLKANMKTTGAGLFSLRTRSKSGARYRVQWTSPSGETFTGPLTRAYKAG